MWTASSSAFIIVRYPFLDHLRTWRPSHPSFSAMVAGESASPGSRKARSDSQGTTRLFLPLTALRVVVCESVLTDR